MVVGRSVAWNRPTQHNICRTTVVKFSGRKWYGCCEQRHNLTSRCNREQTSTPSARSGPAATAPDTATTTAATTTPSAPTPSTPSYSTTSAPPSRPRAYCWPANKQSRWQPRPPMTNSSPPNWPGWTANSTPPMPNGAPSSTSQCLTR